MSGRNSRTTFDAAVDANEMPAFCAILPGPFQLGGPQTLEIALAPITPAVPENEKESRPPVWRAVNVLTSAWRMRRQAPDWPDAK